MEAVLPNDTQILCFLLEEPNPIMILWCRRQVQLYIDQIQNGENGNLLGDILFQNIKPVHFKESDWLVSDMAVMGLLPMSVTRKMSRKMTTQVCKLIRMVYFLDFFKASNPKNTFTGKFEFITDYKAIEMFKDVFWTHSTHDQRHNKRRNVN